MNNNALKLTAAFFESKNFYFDVDDENDVIITGVGGLKNKGSMKMYIIFDDNERTVGIRSHNFCNFPAEKKAKMYEVCSKMNDSFRWAKFYVDEKDNTITVSDDAVVSLDNCGEELFELVLRMSSIGDDAYPEFMKALWA